MLVSEKSEKKLTKKNPTTIKITTNRIIIPHQYREVKGLLLFYKLIEVIDRLDESNRKNVEELIVGNWLNKRIVINRRVDLHS